MSDLTVKLRKSGNAHVVSIPPVILKQLNLHIGDELKIDLENGRFAFEPVKRKVPTLEELLARVPDGGFPTPEDIKIWEEAPPIGKEII